MNIYFFCCPYVAPTCANYEHEILSIAEGLLKKGIQPKGNINYWLKSCDPNDFLIKEYHPKNLDEFDAVIFSSLIYRQNNELLPKNLFNRNRKYKILFLDPSDGFFTPGFDKHLREVDHVLKSHYCKNMNYPQNFIPWQFGLNDRIIQYATKFNIPFEQRQKKILSNFRVRHSLREKVEKISEKYFYPLFHKNEEIDSFSLIELNNIDKLFWERTGRRHYPNFYKRLSENIISNAVGGYIQCWASGKKGLHYKILRGLYSKFVLPSKIKKVYQFDSWRFWESLAAGCCTIHLDFEKYNMVLPEMPINGQHYIGLDLGNPTKVVEILKDKNRLQSIAEKGKEWALKNYSPEAIADRVIGIIRN